MEHHERRGEPTQPESSDVPRIRATVTPGRPSSYPSAPATPLWTSLHNQPSHARTSLSHPASLTSTHCTLERGTRDPGALRGPLAPKGEKVSEGNIHAWQGRSGGHTPASAACFRAGFVDNRQVTSYQRFTESTLPNLCGKTRSFSTPLPSPSSLPRASTRNARLLACSLRRAGLHSGGRGLQQHGKRRVATRERAERVMFEHYRPSGCLAAGEKQAAGWRRDSS